MDTLFRFPDINGPFRGSHARGEGWLTTRQLRSTLLVRLFRDVYLPRTIEITHELRCQAAALVVPHEAVLTGCSAAAIRGMNLARTADPVEFVVPEPAKFVRQPGMDIRRSDVLSGEYDSWRSIRIATPLRMVLDVLFNTRLRPSLPRTVGQLDALLRAGFVELDKLRAVLAARHDHGVVRARQACELADPRSESVPESELRVWLTLSGLPPEVQVKVYAANGQFLGRLDLAYPAAKLAVEYDGKWHELGIQPRLDEIRRARMRAAGWEFVIVTSEMLGSDPRAVVDVVRAALRRRNAA